jgi:hypothetical protein
MGSLTISAPGRVSLGEEREGLGLSMDQRPGAAVGARAQQPVGPLGIGLVDREMGLAIRAEAGEAPGRTGGVGSVAGRRHGGLPPCGDGPPGGEGESLRAGGASPEGTRPGQRLGVDTTGGPGPIGRWGELRFAGLLAPGPISL